MRPDKVTLAAVAATLGLYVAGVAVDRIPVWRMIAASVETLRERADRIAAAVANGATVADVASTVGGGSLPGETLPSVAVAFERAVVPARSIDRLLAALRTGSPPVVGRIEDGRALFDVRTVDPSDDAALIAALRDALSA